MKAVVFHEHGGPEVLRYEERPEPRVRADEVLVEERACALNHLDVWARGGLPGIEIPLPHILGNDVAGVVREAGELVYWVKPGDEVLLQPGVSCGHCRDCLGGADNTCPRYDIIGYRRDGGYAELVAAPGVNVLVHAAGSGVGSIGIQIAKLRGARVIATAGSEEKRERARALGADEVVDYTREDWPKEVRRLTGRQGVDVVFEHTGAETWPGSVLSLKRDGRLVTCGATSGYDARTDLRQVFYRHLNLLGSFMGSKAELLDAMKFVERGQFRAVIDRTLPLAEARRAHELMQDRAQFGKLVLEV